MRCGYCYAGEKTKEAMTDEVIEQSIEFIIQEVQGSQANKLVLAFLGGEPLMEKKKLFYIQDEFKRRLGKDCLLYTSPSPRDLSTSRMPSSA